MPGDHKSPLVRDFYKHPICLYTEKLYNFQRFTLLYIFLYSLYC